MGKDEAKRASEVGVEKKKLKASASRGFDMDRLAEGLQKLGEDDLLQVVQMVHDHKDADSWMRNDVEGEFERFWEGMMLMRDSWGVSCGFVYAAGWAGEDALGLYE